MSSAGRVVAGLAAVAATYVFFLLWAQFGFLQLLQAELSPASVQRAMAAMGLAGLAASFGVARALAGRRPERWVPASLAAAALSALVGPWVHGAAALTAVAAWTGGATAAVTVTLASGARALLGERHWAVGLGTATGIAYLLCNVPALFEGPPLVQGRLVAALALGAAWGLRASVSRRDESPADRAAAGSATPRGGPATWAVPLGVGAAAAAFLVLVWVDSSAFAAIQDTPRLKAASWGGPAGQWRQGAVHLVGALAAGWWIGRRRFGAVLAGAWVCFALGLPALAAGAAWGAPLYALGISLYSVALVAYPSLGGPGGVAPRWRAAWVFGIAGWLGSALGVGMAQELHRIEPAMVLGAGAPLLLAIALGARPAGLSAWVRSGALPAIAVVGGLLRAGDEPPGGGRGVEGIARGRAVYVAEGCIHCHSQYVRPGTGDVLLWGPARPLERAERPALVGNRRQGPDLSNVGNRRSREWQRLHLDDPRSLVAGSTMPSYRRLFAAGDDRGEALLDYLVSLGEGTGATRWEQVAGWRLPAEASASGSPPAGRALFARHCAVCHGEQGRGDGPQAGPVHRPAMDLRKGPSVLLSTWGDPGDRAQAAARLIRFGAPGTPMPGHELLSDREVADLVALVLTWAASPADRESE